MSETALQKAIVAALRAAGFWVIRVQVTGRRSTRSVVTGEPGLPDLYLPGLGHIEVKLPGGKLRAEQAEWHAKASRHGVNVGVATSARGAIGLVMSWKKARAA